MRTRPVQRVKRGFTLIEILIVVVILGILAAIVIPQFTDASQQASASTVKSTLQTLRSQVELYRVKNSGTMPGTFPDDLLVPPNGEEPYLSREPEAPAGFQYDYDELNAPYVTASCTAENTNCPGDIADW